MLERGKVSDDRIVPFEFSNKPHLVANTRQPLVRIHVLGSLRATTYLGDNVLPRGRKARGVLGYLCLSAGDRVARSRLATLLWDRVADRQARTSFRQALRELSAAMGPLAGELIEATLDTVRLDPQLCWVDALAVLSPEPAPPDSNRGDLASLCMGELLEDLTGITPAFDQWLVSERTRFGEELRRLFERELHQLSESAAPSDRRASLARRVISFDPTHEGACRILIRALLEMGERAQALREYERCRFALRSAFDVEPSPETQSLYQAIKVIGARNVSEPIVRLSPETGQMKRGSERLRVGVVPLRNDGLVRNDGLGFSLSQEIAAALARFRWFDVIAPSCLVPDQAVDERVLPSRQLDYLVEGDLSNNGEKYQISVRLLDISQEPRPVWNERFELTADNLDQLNEQVVGPVVARIDPVILFIEGQQSRPARSGATSLVLQAIPLMYSLERDKYEEAGRLITEAIAIDPENAKAAAWGAYWHVWYIGQGWAAQPAEGLAKAQELSLKAIKSDPENAEALGLYAHICAFLDKDFDSALYYFDRALRLNPNLAVLWAMSAPTYCYIGQPEEALRRLDRYRDLAPFDPHLRYWEGAYTIAYMFQGDYEQAARIGRRVVRANPEFSNGYKPLIAALGHLGRSEEATSYVNKMLLLEPDFTVEKFGRVYPFRRAEDRTRYMEGLRRAGVPESEDSRAGE